MDGILFAEKFIENPNELFDFLKQRVVWDHRMVARKTASCLKSQFLEELNNFNFFDF